MGVTSRVGLGMSSGGVEAIGAAKFHLIHSGHIIVSYPGGVRWSLLSWPPKQNTTAFTKSLASSCLSYGSLGTC